MLYHPRRVVSNRASGFPLGPQVYFQQAVATLYRHCRSRDAITLPTRTTLTLVGALAIRVSQVVRPMTLPHSLTWTELAVDTQSFHISIQCRALIQASENISQEYLLSEGSTIQRKRTSAERQVHGHRPREPRTSLSCLQSPNPQCLLRYTSIISPRCADFTAHNGSNQGRTL